jgi:hypothetical protein
MFLRVNILCLKLQKKSLLNLFSVPFCWFMRKYTVCLVSQPEAHCLSLRCEIFAKMYFYNSK